MDQNKQGKKKHKRKHKLHKDDITVVDKDVAKKAITATAMGNAMEWFDFGIYSYLAAIMGKVFFPATAAGTQLILAFATFAVAFLVRPIGGIFFGMLGDRLGRKKILAITLIIMSLATLSIGILPTYETIGITAPILLLLARLVQGFSTGGEYSGAMTFIAESTPDKKRGIMASGLEVGTLVGFIGGSGIVTLLTFVLGSDTMLAWGWRIPFIIAAPLGFIGLYLRQHLEETPAFEKLEEQKEKSDEEKADQYIPMKDILIHHKRPLLIGLTLVFFYNIILYTLLTYMPSHLSEVLGYGETKGLLLILIIMFIMIPLVIVMGYFGDRIGNKRIIQSSLIGLIVLSIPSFLFINSDIGWMVFVGLLILAALLAALQGTMPSQLPSLFFTNVRYGGLAITYNVSTSIFGGTAPLIVTWLVDTTGSNLAPSFYVVFASLIGIVVVTLFLQNTSGKPLRGSPPAIEEEKEIQEVMDNTEENVLWWSEEKQKIDNRISDSENNQDE